jgi:hypothetical protein
VKAASWQTGQADKAGKNWKSWQTGVPENLKLASRRTGKLAC